jgi:hypothetical protein
MFYENFREILIVWSAQKCPASENNAFQYFIEYQYHFYSLLSSSILHNEERSTFTTTTGTFSQISTQQWFVVYLHDRC